MFYQNVGMPVRASAKHFFTVGLVLLLVGMGYSAYSLYKESSPPVPERAMRSEVPLTSAPDSSWPKLVMAPGGKSEHIPVPPYMHVVMRGDNFRLHNVYRDGHECASGESCIDGPLAAVYATNKDMENQNIVSYSYAPMK